LCRVHTAFDQNLILASERTALGQIYKLIFKNSVRTSQETPSLQCREQLINVVWASCSFKGMYYLHLQGTKSKPSLQAPCTIQRHICIRVFFSIHLKEINPENGNCIVCRNAGELLEFNTTWLLKPKSYIKSAFSDRENYR
jgi:hypothetical protein